jgi:hypothetical protein
VIPTSFQTPRALRIINIAAVGLALAGVVAPVLRYFFSSAGPGAHFNDVSHIGLVGGLPTLICGMLWAWLLGLSSTVSTGTRKIRTGWAASIPLAMLNSGLTAALMMSSTKGFYPGRFLVIGLFGATFGVVLWGPALLITLACFGPPIAWAQRLAKKGLTGEERGEVIIGLTCVAISVVGQMAARLDPYLVIDSSVDAWIIRGFSLLGLLAGAASAILALAREARRRAFVADTRAGKIPGYRIEATDEGKVLVRVVAQGEGYRVADFEEEVFELDEAGQATRPRHVDAAKARRHDVT